MAYRYDLHCHTKEGSKCGSVSAKELVEIYSEIGYSGICVTNHFTGSTNPLPDDAPWNERVDYFYDIYKKARREGKKTGLDVFFGIEYSVTPDIKHPSQTTGTDFLILNITKEWLIKNREIFLEKPKILFKKIRDDGGFVIHAHPMFGEEIRLYPYFIDAVEVINGGMDNFCNKNAKIFARSYGLSETGGTDIHRFDHKAMAGMETETPCSTVGELVCAIKEGKASPFSMARRVSGYWKKKQLAADGDP